MSDINFKECERVDYIKFVDTKLHSKILLAKILSALNTYFKDVFNYKTCKINRRSKYLMRSGVRILNS